MVQIIDEIPLFLQDMSIAVKYLPYMIRGPWDRVGCAPGKEPGEKRRACVVVQPGLARSAVPEEPAAESGAWLVAR